MGIFVQLENVYHANTHILIFEWMCISISPVCVCIIIGHLFSYNAIGCLVPDYNVRVANTYVNTFISMWTS